MAHASLASPTNERVTRHGNGTWRAEFKRILTSHTGSLPRPARLIELLQHEERGEIISTATFEPLLFRSVMEVVERRVRAGLELVNDGEYGKSSYATYIQQRLSGFSEVECSRKPPEHNLDFQEFREYYQRTRSKRGLAMRRFLACTGPVTVGDSQRLTRDIENLGAASLAARPVGTFMTASSPGVIDSTTNFVQHPQLVAQRICQYADVVGRERVIAGVDWGFETFAGDPNVDAKIVYRKIESLAERARIASEKLWPRAKAGPILREAVAQH